MMELQNEIRSYLNECLAQEVPLSQFRAGVNEIISRQEFLEYLRTPEAENIIADIADRM